MPLVFKIRTLTDTIKKIPTESVTGSNRLVIKIRQSRLVLTFLCELDIIQTDNLVEQSFIKPDRQRLAEVDLSIITQPL